MAAHVTYSIPCHRDMTLEEHALLTFLLEREDPSRIAEVWASPECTDTSDVCSMIILEVSDGKED
jgi:hypothetical protein